MGLYYSKTFYLMMEDDTRNRILRHGLSTDEIYERIVIEADEEMHRPARELLSSGLAGGFAITITVLLYVSMTHSTDGAVLASAILYPIGFVYIILGNYQLYTENTLPPVALVLDRIASIPAMLRMWGLVLVGNLAGGTLGAVVLAFGGVFSPGAAMTAVEIGMTGVETEWWSLFFKAMFAGLIVAGVVWMDFSVTDSVTRFFLVYMAFLAIPLGNLYHVVVASTEVMYLVFLGEIALLTGATQFVLPVLLGNTIGGVLLVTVVNYYQTSTEIHEISITLDPRGWLFSYEPGTIDARELEAELEQKIEH